jgi:hypothetical protein
MDLEAIWNDPLTGALQTGSVLTSRLRIWIRETQGEASVLKAKYRLDQNPNQLFW